MKTKLMIILVITIFAGLSFGMGKGDDTKEAEKPLKKPEPAATEKKTEKEPFKIETVNIEPKEPVADELIVTVNGAKIMQSDVTKELDRIIKRQSRPGSSMTPAAIESLKEQYRTQIIDMLVEKKIIEQKLKDEKIEVSNKEIEDAIKAVADQRQITIDELKEQMIKGGMSMEDLHERIKIGKSIEKLVNEKIGQSATVTEEDAKKYYQDNKSRYEIPEQVRASHILIKTEGLDEPAKAEAKAKIEGLLKQVKDGADFAELARANSDCPSSSRGGDLNFFRRNQMVPEFDKAAFSMEIGQVSDIVETQFGYHIIKLTDKKEAETKTFESVKEEIISQLENQKKGQFWRDYHQKIKDEAKIEYSPKEMANRQNTSRPTPTAPGGPVRAPVQVKPAPDKN